MKKIEKEYLEKYGDIPEDKDTRLNQLVESLNKKGKHDNGIKDTVNRILNIPYKKIDFTIYLVPKATPRPRSNWKNHIFYVSGAKDNKEIFKEFIKTRDLPMIITPCKFTTSSYFPTPKTMTKTEKVLAEMGLIRPISKPDWDNIGKTYSDMIQGTLLYDDSLIIEGVSKKFYSIKPRIEITIEYMEEFDSNFNERKMRKKVDL